MPLVLTVSELTASGHNYRDEVWVSHEFPNEYLGRVREGELFVYYRGKRTEDEKYVYFGTGMIGEISPSGKPGRSVCQIIGPTEFLRPVSFKRADGTYIEPSGGRGYWASGVRRIEETVFTEIVRLGLPSSVLADEQPALPVEKSSSGIYASPEVARAVEDYSRAQTIRRLEADHPGIDIECMPINNPGYDIRTNRSGLEYVEVKGTQNATPRFFMSDVERRHWQAHVDTYAVFTVYGIDLSESRHVGIREFTGPPAEHPWLMPHQWFGVASDGDGLELGA